MGRAWGRQRIDFGTALLLLLLAALAVWAWRAYAPDDLDLPKAVSEQLPAALTPRAANPTLYKWKDAQGRWNVTDQPPEGRPYEAVQIDPDTNVLPAGVPPEQDND